MPHGDWAQGYVALGLHAGSSKSGHPVKIERIGAYDIAGIQRCRGDDKLNQFYLGMVEHLAQRLDQMSVEEGRLQQTYEVFDLGGLSLGIVNMSALRFTQNVLIAFSTHYPSSFRKAFLINAPPFFVGMWNFLSQVPSPLARPDSTRAHPARARAPPWLRVGSVRAG